MFVVAGWDDFTAVDLLANDGIGNPWLLQNLAHSGSRLGVDVQHAMDDVAAFAGEQPENPPGSSNDFFRPVGHADARDWKLWQVGACSRGGIRILPLVPAAALRLGIVIGQKFSSSHR